MAGFLSKIFSGGAATAVEKVGGVLDKFITTKEEKAQALAAEKARIEKEKREKHEQELQKQAEEKKRQEEERQRQKEEEEEVLEARDPNESIPFVNLLSTDASELQNGDLE